MKTILIMRHGEAQALQAQDHLRELTQRGRQQADHVGQWLAQRFNPQGLLVSPYVRAQQTAECVKEHCRGFTLEQTCDDIIPSANAKTAVDYLQALTEVHTEIDTWLVVAHMPIVSYMVAEFCPEQMPIFATCGVAHIDYDPGTMRARWQALYSPN
ncbi:phosphohistidine phosphatase SixA [Pseudoalteromonas sp. Cnat2-41]|uniref:phosphohistidine phosphatase SixA n=1 Tax=unclassified Pseudoalteromonas TaxID=194690 RepID=UPI001EF8E5A4|nr:MULTISPECIES: phosphohistidine phosphatase SixA [unclassified Pseudoalteromonas]MCF2863525.1 phosphohistidine phosphatase SixA [Pseudoalteromonas sp. CNAT2-18]MCG7558478.1 phosphohistidine phosphatase SixA [Pseudoalteromonas sp. CNAT2-18.1]